MWRRIRRILGIDKPVVDVWVLNGYDELDGGPRHWNTMNILGTVHNPTVNPREGCPGCKV